MSQSPRISTVSGASRYRPGYPWLAIALSVLVAACGSSSSSVDLGSSSSAPPSSGALYVVGGSIDGLSADGLMLSNNGISLSANQGAASFSFTQIPSGTSYAVLVARQPQGLGCSVANATGTVGTANVNNVVVTCSTQSFSLGGTVSGLTGTGLVLANGTDRVSVPANATSFTLPLPVAATSSYAVTVATQPLGLLCSVTRGTGTMPAASVTSVSVSCSNQSSYALGGTISGLNGTGLVLANGSDTVTVAANASQFTLSPVRYQAPYAVTVAMQPAGLTCSVSGGSGTMPANNVNSVTVVCSDQSYTLGGTITGLNSSGLIVTDGTDRVSVASNAGQFSMPTGVAYGSHYAVTVAMQPVGELCSVTAGSGTMPAMDVNSVQVTCVTRQWTWESGSNQRDQCSNYGTLGVATTSNVPGARDSAMSWTDATGRFWLFGGGGRDCQGNTGVYNDLWLFDPASQQWTWVGGSSSPYAPTTSSAPGARYGAETWTDSNGVFWLLGGYGVDSTGHPVYLNDLWSYDPGAGTWTWVSGTAGSTTTPAARIAGASWFDHAGHLWLFGGQSADSSNTPILFDDLWSFDLSTKQWSCLGGSSTPCPPGTSGTQSTPAGNQPDARADAMTWTDSQGVLWLFGGEDFGAGGTPEPLNDLWSYDTTTYRWNLVTQSGTTPGARYGAVTWTDSLGERWLFGGASLDSNGNTTFLNDLWSYDPGTSLWTLVSGSSTPDQSGIYPAGPGTATSTGTPGSRVQGVAWIDANDGLWMFGGYGYDAAGGSPSDLNDLWKY